MPLPPKIERFDPVADAWRHFHRSRLPAESLGLPWACVSSAVILEHVMLCLRTWVKESIARRKLRDLGLARRKERSSS